MIANGDAAKKIWGTEAGIPTGAAAGSSVTPAQQAQMVVDYFNGWNVTYRAWTGPLFWFQVRDSGANPSVIEQNLGLVYHNAKWTPKPAYATFTQQVARRI
jgi:hypothetical protein